MVWLDDDSELQRQDLQLANEAAKRSVNHAANESAKKIAERNKLEDPWEAEGFWMWWGRTSPPNRKEKDMILHLPGPPAEKSSSRSKRKRKPTKPPLMSERFRLL